MNAELEQITQTLKAKHGAMPYISKRDKYIAEWHGSEGAHLKSEQIDPVPMTYEIARLALWHQMKAALAAKNKEFYITETNAKILPEIIRCMIGDVDGMYNPGKGLYLYGPYSSGKTWIMKQIAKMLNQAKLTKWYDNVCAVEWYSYKSNIMMRARKEKDISFISDIFRYKDVIIIDDLAYENDSELRLWGNTEEMVVHLVEILYDRYQNGATVHFTSNIQIYHPMDDQPSIQKKYGDATHDRLMEMCTPVRWDREINLRTQEIYK